jgi:hypothetical protein
MFRDEITGVRLGDSQSGWVDIMQDNLTALQHLALQDIANCAVAKLGASRPNQNNVFSHTIPPFSI